jgi:hypothetical protein
MSNEAGAVKQLDHLIVRADDPQPLFKLLSDAFEVASLTEGLKELDRRRIPHGPGQTRFGREERYSYTRPESRLEEERTPVLD